MKKVAIVGCGAYMDSGYGCPGEWRCLKANAKPACPYTSAEEMAQILQNKTGIPVVLGTHEYH